MSNLNLPTMTFDALLPIVGEEEKTHTIAYATTATYAQTETGVDPYIIIRHHNTIIAEIGQHTLFVTNAGYHSQTTRGRIHKILTDNRQDYGFLVLGQSKGDQVLSFRTNPDTWNEETTPIAKERELTRWFTSATWDFEAREVSLFEEKYSGTAETVTL